ncbi:hypothetical protein GALMADRAFT_282566, partial [Galerina marginata CBS 339.88]
MGPLLDMPPPTFAQGVNSKTFKPPPINSFLSVPDVYDWHSRHSKNHPFFVYFDEATNENKHLLWGDVVLAIHRIANSISTSLATRKDAVPKPLVGLYSSSDTLTYILALVGILRAGFPIFLISNRLPHVALHHLIVKSGVSHILTNQDDKELNERLQRACDDSAVDVTVSHIPPWATLFAEANLGSTALPELNPWTHKMVHTALWQPCQDSIINPGYGERDICGQILSTPSIPMAGASGVMQALFTASSGLVISGLQPASPPSLPNPHNVWKSMITTGSTYSFILQPFLSLWSQDPDKVQTLAKLEGVMFGGGPLPKLVGDKLAESGVNLFTLFGSSEGGLLNAVFPVTGKMGMNWEWFSFYSVVHPGFREEPGEHTVELILKVPFSAIYHGASINTSPMHKPTRANGEFDDVPAFFTGDLLEPHPTLPGFWRYVCRVADQESIGPGPKINVVALARVLMMDPLIAGAVVLRLPVDDSVAFGAIIEPIKAYADLSSIEKINSYRESVWPTFERYNDIAPDAGKLTREVRGSELRYLNGYAGPGAGKYYVSCQHVNVVVGFVSSLPPQFLPLPPIVRQHESSFQRRQHEVAHTLNAIEYSFS